ncbi:MAG: heavy-metal-associated domain-containing protein [Flavisolibacter sp.]
MKSLFLSLIFASIATIGFAQTKSETLKVSGECGSCKKKIESAAKKAGATYAVWDVDSKELAVKYNSTTTNSAKIQKAIADVGYDTQDYKATDEAYNKLDGCCQYDRTNSKAVKTEKPDSTNKN